MQLLQSADWPRPASVRALQTRRDGGVSRAPCDSFNLGARCGDDPAAVAHNRERLCRLLALPAAPVWLDQVHGVTVVAAATVPAGTEPAADASWTDRTDVVCAVLTADCLPALFASDDGRVIAAAHAGWRGLAGGVLEATVAALPAAPSTVSVWLGAAIGPRAFEVGPEVRKVFVDLDPAAVGAFVAGADDRWFADIYVLARLRLARAGVTRVYGGAACTHTEAARYYSFRRDARCGRMASLIWRPSN